MVFRLGVRRKLSSRTPFFPPDHPPKFGGEVVVPVDYLPLKSVGGISFGAIGELALLTALAMPTTFGVITAASIAPDRRRTDRGDGEPDSQEIQTRSSSFLRADEPHYLSGRAFPGSRTPAGGQ